MISYSRQVHSESRYFIIFIISVNCWSINKNIHREFPMMCVLDTMKKDSSSSLMKDP